MTKNLSIFLISLFLIQLFIASSFELAHDEAYYWLYSRHLSWGYFDHPPFVGVVIKLFSFLPHSELSVRLGFIILQFATLFLLMGLTQNSLLVVFMFFSFPLASFSGILALPDMPLLFMTACFCYQLKKYLDNESIINSIVLGLVISVLLYAKYHGVLLVFFTILAVPKILTTKSFYLVAAVAIIAFFPHLLWQYDHDFSTLRYHFIERPSSSFNAKRTLEYIGIQLFLAGLLVGPIVWSVIFKENAETKFKRSMKFITIGTVIFFFISSLSKKVEANWTIFLAVPMIYLSYSSDIWNKKFARNLLLTSFGIVVLARLILLTPPSWGIVRRLNEFNGWKKWAQEQEKLCEGLPLMANTYQIASKLSYYLQKDIPSLNYHSRKNQFDYWRFDKFFPTKEVCYITNKNEFEGREILDPEGKKLWVIKNMSMDHLWRLKYSQR